MLKKPEESLTGIIMTYIEESEEVTIKKVTPSQKYLFRLIMFILALDPKFTLSKGDYLKIKQILSYARE